MMNFQPQWIKVYWEVISVICFLQTVFHITVKSNYSELFCKILQEQYHSIGENEKVLH